VFRSRLQWSKNFLLNNAAALGANSYFIVNNPINAILSETTTASGFSNLCSLYSNFRVIATRLNFEFCNKEAFPIQAYLCPVNITSDGSTPAANDISSTTKLRYLTGQPSYRDKMVGSTSSKPDGRLRLSYSMAKYSGVKYTGVNDAYTGIGQVLGGISSPASLLYAAFGIWTADSATVLVSGAAVRVSADYDIVFTGIQTLTS
jgi:hypothetical protein